MEIKETKRKHDAACEKIGWLKGVYLSAEYLFA